MAALLTSKLGTFSSKLLVTDREARAERPRDDPAAHPSLPNTISLHSPASGGPTMGALPPSRRSLQSSADSSPLSLGTVALFVGSSELWHKPQPPLLPPNSTRGQMRVPVLGPHPPCLPGPPWRLARKEMRLASVGNPANGSGLRSGVARRWQGQWGCRQWCKSEEERYAREK